MKRVIISILLIIVLIPLELINWICMFLDYLFFPDFRKTMIQQPVFIIGMPRSATTLCFSILSSDEGNFSSMKLWEILFAPSVIQKKLLRLLNRADNFCGNVLYHLICKLDRFFFSKNDPFNYVSLFKEEEDEFLLLHIFFTPFLILLFPWHNKFYSMVDFDTTLSARQKLLTMVFYRSCIKRHLYVAGKGRRYLSKNPSHSPRIMSLTNYFKGAQFIYMLRDPLHSIASAVSMFMHFEKGLCTEADNESILSYTLRLADIYFYYPLVTCKDLVRKTMLICHFKDITSNSSVTVEAIYDFCRLEPPAGLIQSLSIQELDTRKYISRNRYNFEELGLEEKYIHDRYSFVYSKFSV